MVRLDSKSSGYIPSGSPGCQEVGLNVPSIIVGCQVAGLDAK